MRPPRRPGRARRGRGLALRVAVPLALLALLVALGRIDLGGPAAEPPALARSTPTRAEEETLPRLTALYEARRSGVWVEGAAPVDAVLPDDRRGSRHQRLILRIGPRHTVLLSHNIDLAPRIDGVEEGDPIAFRGRYEWNPEGGVVHWTHHDPDRRLPGGYVRHEGRTYR
jgi:hypothetical protein